MSLEGKVEIKVKRLELNAKIPRRFTTGAAGFDLFATEYLTIHPGAYAEVKLGIAIDIPKGYYGKISSRSGLAFRYKVFAFDGTIDSDYKGEITVLLNNDGKEDYRVKPGERIAQLILLRYLPEAEMVEASELSMSERYTAGFGSTGR